MLLGKVLAGAMSGLPVLGGGSAVFVFRCTMYIFVPVSLPVLFLIQKKIKRRSQKRLILVAST